jgi:TRAP-type C4-dicarboxylate transport system permease small subunit
MELLRKLDKLAVRALTTFSLGCFVALFMVLLINVMIRITSAPIKMSWYSEVVELLFAYMVMASSAVLCQKKQHFKVDLLVTRFGTKRHFYYLEVVTNLISLTFFSLLLWYSTKLTIEGNMTMTILPICKRWGYMAIPICALFLCIYTIRDLYCNLMIAIGRMPIPAATM